MHSLLPPNATEFERSLETIVRSGFDLPVKIDTLWSAQDCPAELLPYLAWALSVDYWKDEWPEITKRQVIAASVQVHRHKGTAGALKTALASLDLGVRISEWFEHGGEPHTFRADVDVTDRGITQDEIDTIFAVIASTKNARSHLEALRVFITHQMLRGRIMLLRSANVTWIQAYEPETPPAQLTRRKLYLLRSATVTEIAA